MKRKIFIYVGAHKTGSTFLHRELVKLEPQLAKLGCRYDHEGVKYAKALLARGFPIDPLTVAKLRREIELAHASWTERNILLISEHFMGNPYTGYQDVNTVAKVLPSLFPDCEVHVLLSVRRQDHFLESWYNQSIKEGGFWTFDEFMAGIAHRNLDWNRIASCYEEHLGPDRVRVVAYENMYKVPEEIIDAHLKGWAYEGSLKPVSHQPVNPSVSCEVIELLRQSNRALHPLGKAELRKILETCAPKPKGQSFGFLGAEERERIVNLFRVSNDALATRHPLAKLDHHTAETAPSSARLAASGSANVAANTPSPVDPLSIQVLQLIFRHNQEFAEKTVARLAECKEQLKRLETKNAELTAKAEQLPALNEAHKKTQRLLSEKEAQLQDLQNRFNELQTTARATVEGIHRQARRAPAFLIRNDLRRYRNQLRRCLADQALPTVIEEVKAIDVPAKKTKKADESAARLSNPVADLARPAIKKQVAEWKGLPENERHKKIRALRREAYLASGESDKVQALRDRHAGKRCFIIGNGPSLNAQDLSLLKDEVTFVSNWFVNADQYAALDPKYYCVSSHEMFGGWNRPDPKLNPDYYAAMQAKARAATKFFSFAFRDYIRDAGLFPDEEVNYLLFERPKRLIDKIGKVNLDLTKHLDDGYTVIQTMCIPLALHMGCTEIYLLGCDCDYGIQKADDPKRYCYDSRLHTTATSKFESLQRIWADDGPVFKSYEILRDALAKRGVKLINATQGGRLHVLPKAPYESLFQ